MLSSAEIARGSTGAIKFLLRDPTAPSHFDDTLEGCLRSFRVMFLAAPVYALYLVIHYMQTPVTADETEIAFVESLHFVVDWLLYPVIFFEIARRRGWLARYPRYISALNWINLPILLSVAIFECIALLIGPSAILTLLGIVLQAGIFYWLIMTARLALGVNWGLAVVLLVVNWMPSYFLLIIVNRLLGAGIPG